MAYHLCEYEVGGCSVTFPFARVASRDEPLFAEDGTTQVATRYDLTISGVITADTVSDFQALVWKLRNVLNRRGGDLRISWSDDNSDWKDIFRFTEDEDIEFGPRPVGLEIVDFTGGLAAAYSWHVIATTHECFASCSADPSAPTADILSLTRTYRHSIGASGFSTRSVSGSILIKSTAILEGRTADLLRAIPLPPLPSNFTRGPMEFTQSPDGRTLQFSVEDKEVMWPAEAPITEPEANYSVSMRSEGGLADYALTGRFKAPANVSKQTILQRIGNLLFSKLPTGTYIWDRRSLTESLYAENSVSFDFAWHGGDQAEDAQAIDLFQNFGSRPPGTDASQPIGPYGGDGSNFTSGIRAGVPRLYDACNPSGLQVQKPNAGGSSTPTIEITQPRDTPPPSPGGNGGETTPEHRQAPYAEYHERYSYEGENHLVTLSPKVVGGKVVVQQTALPTQSIIQAGYLTREGKAGDEPGPAKPLYPKDSPVALVDRWFVSPANVIPLSVAGMYRFTISWRYVFSFKTSPDAANGMSYPGDKRISTDAPSVPEVEGLVIQPEAATP